MKGMILGLLMIATIATLWAASPPSLVNYQGVLRTSGGVPITGSANMVFTFYDDPSAGAQILIDSHTGVVVDGGLFTVQLGGGTLSDGSGSGTYGDLASVFCDYGMVYVEIAVDGEALNQRVRVISSAYALNADNLDGFNSTAFAPTTHPHSGADITSGIVNQSYLDGAVARDSEVMSIVLASDGSGSTLDTDTLDGLHASDFLGSGADNWVNTTGDTMTGRLNLATTSEIALNANINSSYALASLQNAGSGYPIYAQTTYASRTGSLVPAILGTSSGASTNGENVGVQGSGQGSATNNYGGRFYGQGNSGTKYGIYASASGTNENRAGYFWAKQAGATNNYALYAEASGASGSNYAGYFSGNVSVTGGKLSTAATATATAGLTLPHGTAPTAPVNGDLWTTTGGLYAQINGSTLGPFITTSITDHGLLTGLGDDDHPQYFSLSQSETVNGIPAFNGGTSGAAAPFAVDSTFLVTNLNADLLDGQHAAAFMTSTTDNWVNTIGDTMTGKLTTAASAAGAAGLTLPHGAAPSTPVNGDIWTTTGGLYARINGTTNGPFISSSITAHGALTGLADDDHPQYFALAQNETVTGTTTFSATSTDIRGQIVDGDSAYVTIGEDAYISGGHLGVGTAPVSTNALTTSLTSGASTNLTGIVASTESTETAAYQASITGASIDANASGASNDSAVLGIYVQARGAANSTGPHTAFSGLASGGTGTLNGVFGQAVAATAGYHYGVYGRAEGFGTNYGVYGRALSGTANWGLYTPDDAFVGGALDFGAGADDDLTAADVTELTGGGATILHYHELTVDYLDPYFLRSDIADNAYGRIGFLGGQSGISAPFEVDSTFMVTNLNANYLGGIGEQYFFRLAENELVTGTPYFNGGDTDISPPFHVDSWARVDNLNADRLDDHSSGYFLNLDSNVQTKIGKVIFNPSFGDYGVESYGPTAGGYFKDATESGYALLGNGGRGIQSYGNEAGGYFECNDGVGVGYSIVGRRYGTSPYDYYGIRSYGDTAGGYFYDNDASAWAYVGSSTYKITGSGTVSFVQNHPADKEKVIVYAAPEGDEVATYTRGSAKLVNGEAKVKLGGTFAWVTNPDIGLTAHLTSRGQWADLYVESLSTAEIVVKSKDPSATEVAFDFIVYGLRIGFEEVGIVQEKKQEAYIPAMTDHRNSFAVHPELRAFNALERFKGMRTDMGVTESLDLSNATVLKNTIHEFDPAVDVIPDERSREDGPGADRTAPEPNASPVHAPLLERAHRVTGLAGNVRPAQGAESTAGEAAVAISPAGQAVFTAHEAVERGDLLVINPANGDELYKCFLPADPMVVGIAANEAPPMGQVRVAQYGTTWVKADATTAPIARGDLLVASPTLGHAMKAPKPAEQGTIIGKALEPLQVGTGMIKVLVMLR